MLFRSPYIAVIFANGGREPDNTRGFLEHRSRLSSPTTSALARREPPRASGTSSASADGSGDFRGSGGALPGSGVDKG